MANLFLSLLPIFVYFIAGYLSKYFGIVKNNLGELMLKTVFYVNMPAVILLSISSLPLTTDLIFLPLSAVIVHVILAIISYSVANLMKVDVARTGVIIVGSLIMSTSFIVPFALVFYDEIGVGLLLLFDLGNTIMSLSVAYFFAVYYGGDETVQLIVVIRNFVKKFFTAPPALALLLALLLNMNDILIPMFFLPLLDILKFLFTPLIMIALGIFFIPKMYQKNLVVSTIIIRSGVGLLIGLFCVLLFRIDGINRIIVLVGCSAPVGFVTVAFASLENLDVELAANTVSLSAVIGLVFIPLLFLIL